jgi:hypothetical protein
VELVRLHSNPEAEADDLRRIRSAASSPRPVEGSQQPRQHQRRLSMTEVTMLIKELVQRFGNHRLGGTSVLRRHGVELRRAGIPPEDIQEPISLYGQGSSLARLGDRYNVDATTVWRAFTAGARRGDAITELRTAERRILKARHRGSSQLSMGLDHLR